jgi:hypothetical protein
MVAHAWPTVIAGGAGTRMEPNQCFYCHQWAGQPHRTDCVAVKKRIEVKVTFEGKNPHSGLWQTTVPHSWDDHSIEFHFNQGSWCSNNVIEHLTGWPRITRAEMLRISRHDSCICYCTHFDLVRIVDDTPITEDK